MHVYMLRAHTMTHGTPHPRPSLLAVPIHPPPGAPPLPTDAGACLSVHFCLCACLCGSVCACVCTCVCAYVAVTGCPMGVCPGCMLMEVQTRMCPLGHLATSGVGGECAEGAEGAVCAYLRPG